MNFFSRRTALAAISALALAACGDTGADTTPSGDAAVTAGSELGHIKGSADAPVTLIEYASPTCPACKYWHDDIQPVVQSDYIDTGKVKLIFRDFPLGQRALAAHMVASCAGPVRYFAMVSILFRDQATWSQAPDGLAAIQASARKGGMSPAQVDSCLRNEELLQGIQKTAEAGNRDHGVDATPFFVVAGEKVSGAQNFKVFEDIIERALKK